MDPDRLRALEAVYAAGLDPSLWQAAMDAISQASNGVRTHMLCAESAASHLERTIVSGYDPDYLKSWDAHFGAINAWAPAFASGPLGRPQLAEAMCNYDTLRRTEFYADWVRPQDDLLGGGGIVLHRNATGLVLFGGNMPRAIRDHHDPVWQRDLVLFGAAIRAALQTNAALAGLRLNRLLVAEAVADAGPAIFLLDQQGTLLFANGAAEHSLAQGGQVRLRVGRALTLTHEAASTALARALGGRAVRAPSVLSLPGGYVLRIHPLGETTAEALGLPPLPPGRRAAVALALSPPRRQDASAAQILARLYGLTRAEAEIALLLHAGAGLSDIAEQRGASIHTVRNQLKSAMLKTGTLRQADLVLAVERLGRAGSVR